MRTATLGLAFIAGLLAVAGVAAAQDSNETEPRDDGNAWVEDCPPDMMCAMSEPAEEDNFTRDPACEYCRGDNASDDNLSYGDEDCAHCSGASDGPTYDGNCGGEVCAYDSDPNDGTCMDGSGTDCRDDVQYMTPPGYDGSEAAPIRGDATDPPQQNVPAAGIVALAGALGVALALVTPSRRRD